MSAIDDGGPAFPYSATEGSFTREGMSLRDWFAGQALAGIMANQPARDAIAKTCTGPEEFYSRIACNAMEAADAMLAARNAKK